MSKSDSLRRQRLPYITVLAVGEGSTEGAFLLFLKSMYDDRNSGIKITVNWNDGGSPSDIITATVKMRKSADYSKAFRLLDTDIPWQQSDLERAKSVNLNLIGATPCIEGLFLQIIDPSKTWSCRSSKECKKEFHAKYPDETKKLSPENHKKLFSKEIIDTARNKIPILDQIILYFTNLDAR